MKEKNLANGEEGRDKESGESEGYQERDTFWPEVRLKIKMGFVIGGGGRLCGYESHRNGRWMKLHIHTRAHTHIHIQSSYGRVPCFLGR